MHQNLGPLLREQYPVIAKHLLSPLLDVLAASRAACGGDLEKFQILLVVGLRTADHKLAAMLSSEASTLPHLSDPRRMGTNVRSIAACTGIPRETVRRKVAALVADGWIERDGHLLTALTREAAGELSRVRDTILRMAAANHQTVGRLLPPTGSSAPV